MPTEHPTPPSNTLSIVAYLHCGKCIADRQAGHPETLDTSPATYSRLSVGWTREGFQVWCQRHSCNVMHVDFQGEKHPANTTAAHAD